MKPVSATEMPGQEQVKGQVADRMATRFKSPIIPCMPPHPMHDSRSQRGLRMDPIVTLIVLLTLGFSYFHAESAMAGDDKKKETMTGMIEMVTIPGGSFEMGSNNGNKNEKPIHHVSVEAFALGKYEVTQTEWQAVMGDKPSDFKQCGGNCPVEQVSWNDAQEFIRKLNQKTGKSYRLPTEAEWEYACKAGLETEYCGGNDIDSVAWYDGNSNNTTHPVGQKQANAFGLYDMSGNVWEWVQDKYDNEHDARVVRGGSWYDIPRLARAAVRDGGAPAVRDNFNGFRLARTLP